MTARHDWIAVGPRGVYALMDAQLSEPWDVAEFKVEAERRGHRVELVTVAEACQRHHEYLMQFEDMRQAEASLAARCVPRVPPLSFLPSPAQIDLFGEGRA